MLQLTESRIFFLGRVIAAGVVASIALANFCLLKYFGFEIITLNPGMFAIHLVLLFWLIKLTFTKNLDSLEFPLFTTSSRKLELLVFLPICFCFFFHSAFTDLTVGKGLLLTQKFELAERKRHVFCSCWSGVL